jgi:hypothetical protein
MLEHEILFLERDPPVLDANIPKILASVAGIEADDIATISSIGFVDTGDWNGYGRWRRRLGPWCWRCR